MLLLLPLHTNLQACFNFFIKSYGNLPIRSEKCADFPHASQFIDVIGLFYCLLVV